MWISISNVWLRIRQYGNCHRDGNIGNVLSGKESRYCNNAEKSVYNALEFKKMETKEDIKAGIPTVEIKKYLRLNYNFNLFK